jgi:pre-mRNA-splicing factor 18
MEALRALLAEGAAKQAALKEKASGVSTAQSGRKFYRGSELKRVAREEAAARELAAIEASRTRKRKLREAEEESHWSSMPSTSSALASSSVSASAASPALSAVAAANSLPRAEVVRRLRDFGFPTTLYGEGDDARLLRLRSVESTQGDGAGGRELGLGDGFETRNAVMDDLDDAKEAKAEARAARRAAKRAKRSDPNVEVDPQTMCYRFFKAMLREWSADLAARPGTVKLTAKGKVATKTQKQCKDYMRPFFQMCKAKTLPRDILPHIVRIVSSCKEGEYVVANDAYILLAIGNQAWPIGVTQVGIHARAGRERIEESQTKQAHVMNDERARKYITAIKRCMTYCQTKYPSSPSKSVTT